MTGDAQTYALNIEFLGTAYRGWQRQQTAASVQATLETALENIANHPIELIALTMACMQAI